MSPKLHVSPWGPRSFTISVIPSALGAGNHTAGFTASTGKPEAHRLAMNVAKGLACIGAKFLTDDAFAKDVKKAFEKFKKEVGAEADLIPGLKGGETYELV